MLSIQEFEGLIETDVLNFLDEKYPVPDKEGLTGLLISRYNCDVQHDGSMFYRITIRLDRNIILNSYYSIRQSQMDKDMLEVFRDIDESRTSS